MFFLCKCISCEMCGRHFCKMWTCSNVTVTVCFIEFILVLNRQVLVVGVLFGSWFGVMVNVNSDVVYGERGWIV